jgi:hypothetical protein
MPWRCPACGNVIKHDDSAPTPRVGTRYRCHVCRLGLEYRPDAKKLVIVRADDDDRKRRG